MSNLTSNRSRIGLIVPSTNTTAEPDFNMAAPGSVSIHSQRMWLDSSALSAEGMNAMNADVENAAKYLKTSKVDYIVYACTTGSFYLGPGHDEELIQSITDQSGVAATATAYAAAEALNSIGAKNISVASPYNEWQNNQLRNYYEGMGFNVINVESEAVSSDHGAQGHCDLTPESILNFAPTVCSPEADALFCACTAWRSMEVVAELERITNKPVITSNQATVWKAFKTLGINEVQKGYGSLLENL